MFWDSEDRKQNYLGNCLEEGKPLYWKTKDFLRIQTIHLIIKELHVYNLCSRPLVSCYYFNMDCFLPIRYSAFIVTKSFLYIERCISNPTIIDGLALWETTLKKQNQASLICAFCLSILSQLVSQHRSKEIWWGRAKKKNRRRRRRRERKLIIWR